MQNVRTKSAFTPLINTYLKLKFKKKKKKKKKEGNKYVIIILFCF